MMWSVNVCTVSQACDACGSRPESSRDKTDTGVHKINKDTLIEINFSKRFFGLQMIPSNFGTKSFLGIF